MRSRIMLAVFALCMLGLSDVVAMDGQADPHGNLGNHWALFVPSEVAWKDAPASLPPGAKMAILEGDPTKEGFFTMRLQLPDGYRVAPHWHPKTERLTVIAGTVHLGIGDRFDDKATRPLPAGTYSSMPPKMAHFAWMEGDVILQLSSIGPWGVIYVNSADDPRLKTK